MVLAPETFSSEERTLCSEIGSAKKRVYRNSMVDTANSLNLGQQPRDASRSSTTKKKSVSARGLLAETRGGFAGHAAPANALLKRRHAASGNKTNFQLSIFPILGLFSQKR